MGREIYQSDPIEESQRIDPMGQVSQPDPLRKEKIVINLAKAQVDVQTLVIKPQDSEHFKLGDRSTKEGEEQIEIIVNVNKIKIGWKVVLRGGWCLRHIIEFFRT